MKRQHGIGEKFLQITYPIRDVYLEYINTYSQLSNKNGQSSEQIIIKKYTNGQIAHENVL
jgi:hypothetical protein